MMYNAFNDFNDCVSHGACSVSPNISAMREVMILLLCQIAYYLVKLGTYQVRYEDVEHSLISQIVLLDLAKDFSDAQILNSFSKEYANLVKVRKEYFRLCKEKGDKCVDLKKILKFSPKTNLSDILQKGEREKNILYKKTTENYYFEILFSVIKSVSCNLVILYDLNECCQIALDEVLTALDMWNLNKLDAEKIIEKIKILSDYDMEILKFISEYRQEHYGKVTKSSVSLSTRPHKAIMVSGARLSDLANLLEFVKDKDIDVYTNGNLLVAHAFPYFKNFSNLRGHFGKDAFLNMLDFATFPGAILLTKNESQYIQYLYRGRLFSIDNILPQGLTKIENNDFTPLVNSALEAKGFKKGQNRNSQFVGFNEDFLDKKLDEIIMKNCEKIFIIGFSNSSLNQQEYFQNFFSLMPENTFAITFSYKVERENVFSINIGNDYSLLYQVMNKIFEKIPLSSNKFAFFFTKCDTNSLSNIVSLKNKGAKNVFLSDCSPLVINPTVLSQFMKIFDIKSITKPKDDIKICLNPSN